MRQTRLLSVTSCLLLLTTLLCGPLNARESQLVRYNEGPANTPPIRFVGDHSYAPVEYLEEGQLKGVFPEFLPHLARAMQRNVEYQLVDWKEAQRRVLANEADVLTVFSPNPERNKRYDYSKEFLTFDFTLFVRNEEVLIHNLDDLKGRRVGVTKGGTPGEIIHAHSQKITRVMIKDMPDGFNRLLTGEIDAVATTEWVGAYIIQKHGFKGIKPIQKPFFSEVAPMGVRKGDSETLALINHGLAQLEQQHTMDELAKQWSKQEVVYITRGALGQYQRWALLALLGSVFVAGLLFIFTLKKQVKEKTRSLKESLEALHKAQDKLVQLEKMAYLAKIVNGVAHEINTPLGTAITSVSFSQTQLKELREKYQQQKMSQQDFERYLDSAPDSFQLIHSSLNQTALLVDSFKSISVDQEHNQATDFSVNEMLHSVLDFLSSELEEFQPEIQLDEQADIHLHTNQSALFRVVTQLVRNSLTHAFAQNQQAVIRFDQALEDELFVLTYSDNGSGIDQRLLQRIFEPFYTTQRDHKNIGLGLSILYNLVTIALDGDIKASSAPGQGITFTIRLPVRLCPKQPTYPPT